MNSNKVKPFISICIPTYNSGEKLIRLLNSIEEQTFNNYEIIISDDSKNVEIPQLIQKSYQHLNIRYFHNAEPLGTPNNWNNAIKKSCGEWIKIMHHDDCFFNNESLAKFVAEAKRSSGAKLIFSGFQFLYTDTGHSKIALCSTLDIFLLKRSYLNLFKNFIGNPSCTLIHESVKPYKYDAKFKWLIDFDFYVSFFKKDKVFIYINEVLISMGMHHSQVTAFVQNNPNIEVPESYSLLEKHGIGILKNIFVYDFFWRMYRNLGVYNLKEFEKYLQKKNDYKSIKMMLSLLGKAPNKLLKFGVFSKLLMIFAYVKNRLCAS